MRLDHHSITTYAIEELNAQRIKRSWTLRKVNVEVWVESIEENGLRYNAVRSNLINGLPRKTNQALA